MKVSHAWIQQYFETPIPSAEKLAELFTFHAFEVEGVEKVGGDTVIDVKVLPDRAHYALSHRGIASEVAALTGLTPRSQLMPVWNMSTWQVDSVPSKNADKTISSITPLSITIENL